MSSVGPSVPHREPVTQVCQQQKCLCKDGWNVLLLLLPLRQSSGIHLSCIFSVISLVPWLPSSAPDRKHGEPENENFSCEQNSLKAEEEAGGG